VDRRSKRPTWHASLDWMIAISSSCSRLLLRGRLHDSHLKVFHNGNYQKFALSSGTDQEVPNERTCLRSRMSTTVGNGGVACTSGLEPAAVPTA